MMKIDRGNPVVQVSVAKALGLLILAVLLLLAFGSSADTKDESGSKSIASYRFGWGEKGSIKGRFNRPSGIVAFKADTGNTELVISDTGNDRIRNYTFNGMFIDKWGSTGSADGQFRHPLGLAVDKAGKVLIADSANNRIQRTEISSPNLRVRPGGFMGKFGKAGSEPGHLDTPADLAVNAQGHIYVVDSNNHRIQKYDAAGKFLGAWGSRGSGEGQFERPLGVAIDQEGHVYIADTGNDRVQKLDRQGRFLTQWGETGSSEGQFDVPRGIAFGGGHIFVADSENHRVQRFDMDGRYRGSFGEKGKDQGQLLRPQGVAVDETYVFVADTGNHRIQVFGLAR